MAACRYAEQAWDQIMFGFRIPNPNLRGLITTTPKPIKVFDTPIAHQLFA